MPLKVENLPSFLLARERAKKERYLDVIEKHLDNPAFWEQFAYDHDGNLYYKDTGYRVAALYQTYGKPHDVPLLLQNTRMVEKRARQWRKIVLSAAEKTRYPLDLFLFTYATKANQKAAVQIPALREMHLETTSALDLENASWLIKNGLVPKEKIVIICNGFKTGKNGLRENSYADRIVRLHNSGVCIIPVLDHGELEHFANVHLKTPLPIGLRLKFGKVKNEAELESLVSRHGEEPAKLRANAQKIETLPQYKKNFKFVMVHAMVSAAETVSPKDFKDYHLFAAKIFFELAKDHPNLKFLNLGGGIPTLGRHYNHKAFLEPYLAGVTALAQKYHADLPIITFETGSLVATDAEALVYGVDHFKTNNVDVNGQPETWAIVKGNVMSGLPDLYVLSSEFDLVAANNTHSPTIWGRIGDETCDSYGRLPSIEHPRELIPFPNNPNALCFLVEGVGAYQDILGGMGENIIQHCGFPSPREVTIWPDGTITAGKVPSLARMSRAIGYRHELLSPLRDTIRPR